jgi:two-component system, NtrC family, response regulator AtoC
MTEAKAKILIVDDEEGMRDSLRVLLAQRGYEVALAADGRQGIDLLGGGESFDAVLCDLRMPNIDGLEFVDRVVAKGIESPVVMMSAYATIDLAVDAMRRGAFSFISKPFKANEVVAVLEKAIAHEALLVENRRLRKEVLDKSRFGEMIGRDDKMMEVFEAVSKIAPYKTSVLITGESGTGKELVARSLHRNSDRASGAFVAVNCGAIPETLLESELFGHMKGAFTDAHADKIGLFERAHGGTLFLDEIAETPARLQVKLLRALQDGEIRPVGSPQSKIVDVRIVAATKQYVDKLVADGIFREDLFYRLSVFPIALPPLRERPGDIPLLVDHFIRVYGARLGIRIKGIRSKALALLMEHNWPGNVRELENAIERAVVLAESLYIETKNLPEKIRRRITGEIDNSSELPLASGDLSVKHNARVMEEIVMRKALIKTRGNKSAAARLLDISHRTLLYKMQKYGIGDEA